MNLRTILKAQEDRMQALESALDLSRKRCDQYAQVYDQIQHHLKELLRNRFGRKSERFIDPEHPQMSLLEDNNAFTLSEKLGDLRKEDDIEIPAHFRKKKKKSDKELPRRVEIIRLNEEQMKCDCGAQKTVIRYESKESMHHQPAVFEILE